MVYKLKNISIKDIESIEIISQALELKSLDTKKEYDLLIEYYNEDLEENMHDKDVSFEIKKHHLKFLKSLRIFFDSNNIKINEISLIGAIAKLNVGDMSFSIFKSKYQNYKKNDIIPCKEVLMYEDGKNTLNFMLNSELISEEEYDHNISVLQEELCIFEFEDESGYVN